MIGITAFVITSRTTTCFRISVLLSFGCKMFECLRQLLEYMIDKSKRKRFNFWSKALGGTQCLPDLKIPRPQLAHGNYRITCRRDRDFDRCHDMIILLLTQLCHFAGIASKIRWLFSPSLPTSQTWPPLIFS